MWKALLFIAVILIIIFLYDRYKQVIKVGKEGGMKHKYRELIEFILSGDPRCKILHLTTDTVILGISNYGNSTLYTLIQTFGTITIVWKVKSRVYGNHKLEWSFDEYGDQEYMAEKISNDLEKYQINVMTK